MYSEKLQIYQEKNKKNILFVVEAMGGGVFTYIVELANALCNEFNITIAYATRPQTPVNYMEYFDKRVHLVKVENFCRSVNLKKDLKACIEIYKIAKEVKPDIIHLHSSKAGIIGRLVFAKTKAKLFYTPHGYSFLMQNYGSWKRFCFKVLEKLFAIKRCKTIACSEGEYKETLKITKNATFVNNGINTREIDSICTKSVKNGNGKVTVFTLGRICNQKNPYLFNEIAELCPDMNFIWIGDGELREVLTAKNILISGWCNRNEALNWTCQADVFMLTSLWEGLPMSLLESMYLKKLCVVSDVIGNHDVIQNGINGYVCTTAEEYANVLHQITPDNARSCQEKAHADIVNEYTIDVMSQKYIQIYNGGTHGTDSCAS